MGNVVVKDLNMLDHIMNEMVKVPRGGGGFLSNDGTVPIYHYCA
jgi:hypothetical protein